jgi:hypothetical protein
MSMNDAGSPIAAILADSAGGVRQAGFERANGGDVVSPGSNLVERIRKLRNAMPRVSSAS